MMHGFGGFVSIVLFSVLQLPVLAQNQDELDKLRKRVDELERRLQGPAKNLPGRAAQEARRKAGQIYSKPFLARFGRGVYVGGYMDLEYVNTEESNSDTFDQHRFVPFIYADISDRMKLVSEIEIEHGEELGIEFATLDYWIAEEISFRAGILLLPLGKFNLVHDAPFQDLTRRPLVDSTVIPAVLRDPGVGFFGSFDLDPWEVSYEVYVSNGFKGLDNSGNTVINRDKGLKDARPHKGSLGTREYRDFNDNKALTARVAVSPTIGLEIGLSGYIGAYDERGDNDLTITALDWTITGGALHEYLGGKGLIRDLLFSLEIVGEVARAEIDRDAFAVASGVPGDMDGWYGEVRFHFMILPSVFKFAEDSTFTLLFRRGEIDLDGDRRDRTAVGLNFRPTEDSVFKIEHEWNGEGGLRAESDNDAWLFSVASYF